MLDAGLDAVFEPLARTSLLSVAFGEFAMEKLSRDPGLLWITCPVHWS